MWGKTRIDLGYTLKTARDAGFVPGGNTLHCTVTVADFVSRTTPAEVAVAVMM